MAGIIYAAPRIQLPPPPQPWVKTGMIWTGHDGSVWDLTDPDGGVVLLNAGVEGLHLPKFTQWLRQSPAVPGQLFTGAIAEPRTVVLPLAVYEDTSSLAWVERDRAFWKSMHPRHQGTLTVSPGGTGRARSIRLRLVPENYAYDHDPAYARWADYTAVMVADQPFWEGQPVTAAFGPETVMDFYEETGPHLVNLMSGHTMASATLTNDGDEDVWPTWTVLGEASAAHVGVGTALVEIPFMVNGGKALVIDTDPRVQTATEYTWTAASGTTPETFTDPVDRTADLTGAVDFTPIPAGGTTPINISVTGTGRIRVSITPLYWRAW